MAGIELRCLRGETLEPTNVADLLPRPPNARHDLTQRQLKVPMLGTSVKLLEATTADITALQTLGATADALDCPWLRVFDGGDASTPPSASHWAQVAAWMADWETQRNRAGIRTQLAVETHDALVHPLALQALRQQLPDLAVLWDLHHTWRAGVALPDTAALLGDAVCHVHLKDSINKPSPRKPFTYCLPGDGKFPWAEALTVLNQLGYRGALSLEWEQHWHPYLPPLAEALPRFRALCET